MEFYGTMLYLSIIQVDFLSIMLRQNIWIFLALKYTRFPESNLLAWKYVLYDEYRVVRIRSI